MLAFSDNPPVLSPGVASVGECVGRWWVAHTKARCEKAFAADLLVQRVAYFLPMTERVTLSGGRKRRGMLPLFPSYVFFCCDDAGDAGYRALATGRLCRLIPVADQRRLVGELSALARVLAAGVALETRPFAAPGNRCRVKAGPFRGVEGPVVRCDGRTRIVLEVGVLGRGVAMEIDADLLERADDDRPPHRDTAAAALAAVG